MGPKVARRMTGESNGDGRSVRDQGKKTASQSLEVPEFHNYNSHDGHFDR